MRIGLDDQAIEELEHWIRRDRKKALRTLSLIRAAARPPFEGVGKPEPLRHSLAGYWSRRIAQAHRLVYRCAEGVLRVLSCRYHYS